MRLAVLCAALCWSTGALASHSYGGLDLCALYPEVMPPGLPPEDLPQPESRGAGLLQGYCEQCHALPGPGRHTAGEWQEVLDRMILLMDVASRFSGLMGHIRVPAADEGEVLRAYLTDHALQPSQVEPDGIGAVAFTSHCGSCHALPDAAQHSQEEWPAVVRRMQRNMTVMQYAPPAGDAMVQIQLYLQQHAPAGPDSIPASRVAAFTENTGDSGPGVREPSGSRRWLALGPFLLLVAIGMLRWWRGSVRT